MGTFLGSISGGFAKGALLGTMFPVLIVLGLNAMVVAPLLSFGPALQDRLKNIALGAEGWPLVAFSFAVTVLTGLLYNLNIPIIRLYEGYPFERSAIGRIMSARWQRRFRRAQPLRLALRYLARDMRRAEVVDPALLSAMGARRTELAHVLNDTLPDREDLVLPTRLGNVIRSFERYPVVAYEMDAIALWPRLVAKIDTGFAATIDDAKTTFDFMLNCSFLTALTAVALVAVWVQEDTAVLTTRSVQWGWRIALFAGMATLFYVWAVGAAAKWGLQVCAAFDLYRFELLEGLGYKQKPATVVEEKQLWRKISMRLVFADSEDPPDYEDPPTRITTLPLGVQIDTTRTLVARADGGFDVTLGIKNVDVNLRTATTVVITETIPNNGRFIVGSLSATGAAIAVKNTAPLEVSLGALAANAEVTVRYSVRLGAA